MVTKGGYMNLVSFLIFAFLCIRRLNSSLVAGASTIGIGDELNSSSDPLVSQGGTFTLGFFSLGAPGYSYLGIWYTNDEQARRVWVANPNTPLLDTTRVVLTIDDTGILKITSGGSTFLNISDQVGTGRVTATLEDSGNFVVMDESERTLWESFDHPINTLLPGMKLGSDLRILTSWLTDDVAASGAFTLTWEPTQLTKELVIRREWMLYWSSGDLINQTFEFMPGLNSNSALYRYNLSYVSNDDDEFFTFSAAHENLPMWVLSPNGQILDAANNSLSIGPTDFCYGYQSDDGCAENEVPECRGHDKKFALKSGDFYFIKSGLGSGGEMPDDDSSLSLSACMQWCWNQCGCVGFASNRTGCIYWTGEMGFKIDDTGNALSKYVLVSENSSKRFGGLDSSLVVEASTIGVGDELNSTDQLVSQGRTFTLGFFSLNNTGYSYLGIWYTNDTQARKVWVANPNTPLLDNSGVVLTIDDTGILKITSRRSTFLNISDQVGTGRVTATLYDSGNFVLMDKTEGWTLWQSFDHPTNTVLPGMKLGLNLRTGQNWSVTSWLSDNAPASGAFTLNWEPTQESGQLVIYRRGEVYWNSGFLRNQSFGYMPALNADSNRYHYNLRYVSNNDERSITFSAAHENLPMWELTPNGQIVDAANDDLVISPADFCYGFQSDNGCANSMVSGCRSRNDTFVRRRRYFPGNSGSYADNLRLSLSDCMEMCWKDCNCVGFINNSNGSGCTIWSGNLEYREDKPNATIIFALASGNSSNPDNSSKGNRWWIWLIIVVAISLLMLFLGLLCYLRIRKRRREGEEKKWLHELTASDNFNNANEIENEGRGGHDLKIFSFASIVAATNDFSNENILGQGGFGPVYKGILSDGREIAIKRLSKTSAQGLVEFKNELVLIAKLQHMNLVRVLGCCIHGEEMMLIYEYMANKSLDFFLFDPTKKELLDWRKRLNIIEGVAQGLLYLHKYSRMRVIHRDLKASNVLLDENMNPKISDFGMARIFKQNETEAVTNRVVGTYGYMSPEYAMEGTFSVKSDVFSFGVLILEIVSGRRNTSFNHLDRPLNLIGHAWELWKEGTAMELKDPTLGNSCDEHQLLRTIHVSLLCVQESSTDRPIISDVISMLSNETMPLSAPKQPAFFTGRSVLEANKSKTLSANGLSISIMEAR